MQRILDLHVELVDAYIGVSAIVTNFRTQTGTLVNEVLLFGENGLVSAGHGTTSPTSFNRKRAVSLFLAKPLRVERI